MRELLALATKDLRLLFRDRAGFFITFVFPLVYAVFFGVIFSNRSGLGDSIEIVIADEDRTEASRSVVAALRGAPELRVVEADLAPAAEQLGRSGPAAYVVIPAGFESAIHDSTRDGPPTTALTVATVRQDVGILLRGIVTRYGWEGLAGTGDPCGYPPFKIDLVDAKAAQASTTNQYALSFPQGTIWGVLGCTAAFGMSLVIERARGTLFRLQAAPVSRARLLAGKAMACFATTVALGVVLFTIGVIFFHIRPNSYVSLGIALVSTAIGFVGIMMLLSVLGRTEQAASGITWTILLGMAMIGGGMVPHFLMPPWIQGLSDYSPVRWAILAMDGAVWRGFTLSEMARPCAALIAVGVGSFAIGARTFRWTN